MNIRSAKESDKITYIRSRLDTFVGDDYFYDISNDILLDEKKKYEEEFNNYIKNTSIIINEGIPVGCFSLYSYQDGILFYIYLLEDYKDESILSSSIKYVISSNRGYLYTIINQNDYEEYKSFGFEIIGKNDKKYKLKINNN